MDRNKLNTVISHIQSAITNLSTIKTAARAEPELCSALDLLYELREATLKDKYKILSEDQISTTIDCLRRGPKDPSDDDVELFLDFVVLVISGAYPCMNKLEPDRFLALLADSRCQAKISDGRVSLIFGNCTINF
jgi:hypothetical protein